MKERLNTISNAAVLVEEAISRHWTNNQWPDRLSEWLGGSNEIGIAIRTSRWIFERLIPGHLSPARCIIGAIKSQGYPVDCDVANYQSPGQLVKFFKMVSKRFGVVPDPSLAGGQNQVYIALVVLHGSSPRSVAAIGQELEERSWSEMDQFLLEKLNRRRAGEMMGYSNFILAMVALICWRYIEDNREEARRIDELLRNSKDAEADNDRTVGTIVDTPTDGTIKIRGIGTPELSMEVVPVKNAHRDMTPDMAGAEIAHNLDFYLTQTVGNWRKNAAIELMERDSFPTIEQSIVHIYADLVGKRGMSALEFDRHMRLNGHHNPEITFSSGTFHGAKATYWLGRLGEHFRIEAPAPLEGLESEIYIAMCLLFEAQHRTRTVGKDSVPFLELVTLVTPRATVVSDVAYDLVMLHALCGCVAFLRANGPLAGEIYRKYIGFHWKDFPMGSVMEEAPEPKVLITKDDVELGELPVPYPIREDSLARELERVTLEALSKPGLHLHQEGRREAGVEPETHATLIGTVAQQADLLSEALALAPRPTSITITLNPDEDADTQLLELINRHGRRDNKPFPETSVFAPVKRKKRGWLTGKFCMLHMGHINFIHQAATQCDELVVVLSHSDKRFKDPRLSYRNKMLWLRTTFKNEPHITVVGIDESNVPEYPNGWQAWSDLVKEKIGTDFDYIFTSEPGDQSGYDTYFPGQEVVVVDAERKGVDISATKIRGDMVKHWGMMPTVVRKDFVMRICIVGTESCGKTSLTKMLAKRNQTSWVEEYGRTYCEQDLCMDEDLLEFDDYGTIAARRYDMEQEAAAAANRVLFVDTAALSTNYFCLLYEGRENMMVSAYQERERYDAYFYLTDDVPFVEDGLRKNRNRDNTRFLFEKMLFANAKRHGSEVFVISGNYNERFNKANEIVDELLVRPLSLV